MEMHLLTEAPAQGPERSVSGKGSLPGWRMAHFQLRPIRPGLQPYDAI